MAMPTQHRYIDLNIAMVPHPMTGDLPRVYDEKAIQQALKTLVLSNKGDFLFRPWMGGNIRNLLFENPSPVIENELKNQLEELIANHEPRVVVNDILVSYNQDNDEYVIDLFYSIVGTTTPLTIKFLLKRAR
ncbi:MAG: hypothetical protein D6732_03515 [Methanobacteriota archaeon]|nr:MAG: hypothetical protein D6732_03515 [Euryarchaeota archaeon]